MSNGGDIMYKASYDDEGLIHYGIKGMRWGVRRATKKLTSATTQSQYDKAINSLNKHKEKSAAKIAKLEKKRPKLEKQVEKHIMKTDGKVAKMDLKISKMEKKAGRLLTSKKKSIKLMDEARVMRVKSDALRAKSQNAKQLLTKNTAMQEVFKKGIRDIDISLIENGKRCFAA